MPPGRGQTRFVTKLSKYSCNICRHLNDMTHDFLNPALKVLVDEKLVENSGKLGPWFLEQLQGLASKSIKLVRGRGLFIGLVLDRPARPYCEALMDLGILCKETHENVIRFAPPLVVTKKDLNWAFKRVEKVFRKLDG